MCSMLHRSKNNEFRSRMIALKTLISMGFNKFPGALSGKEGPVSGPSRLPDVKPPCLKLAPGARPRGVFFMYDASVYQRVAIPTARDTLPLQQSASRSGDI